MAELEDKLNSILGNPAAMEQIMSLAQSLSGGESQQSGHGGQLQEDERHQSAFGTEAQDTFTALEPQSYEDKPASPGGGDVDLFSMLGNIDPRMIQMGMRLMNEYQSGNGKNAAFLEALRPFVKERRYAKLDRAIQIARLSRIIRILFDSFRDKGGDADV